jgi:hypothetical protein
MAKPRSPVNPSGGCGPLECLYSQNDEVKLISKERKHENELTAHLQTTPVWSFVVYFHA